MKARRNQSGLSLIELVIAMSVIAIAMFGILSMIVHSMQTKETLRELQIAKEAVSTKMEEIKSHPMQLPPTFLPLGTTADMAYTLLGILAPPGSTVEFQRFGADPVTVTALPSGLALYAGPSDQVLGLATVHTPLTTLVCGPVGIDNQADFDARQGEGGTFSELKGVPWNCLGQEAANSLSG